MKLKNVRLLALGLLMMGVLAACNLPVTATPKPAATAVPTATIVPQPTQPEPAPAALGAACITGTWKMSGMAEYLQTVLPQLVQDVEITVGDVSGDFSYTFNADGTSIGKAENLNIQATVNTNGVNLPGQIAVNGTSKSNYQVDDKNGLLNLSNVNPGDLTVSAKVAGITVIKDTPVTNVFLFGFDQNGSGSVNYDCVGDTLKISVDIPNAGPRVFVLQRSNQ